MKLLSVDYVQTGTTIGKKGLPIRVMKKRLTLQCPECDKVVVRAAYGAVKAKNCGCGIRYQKHGMAQKHPIYGVWHGMRNRCNNPHSDSYSRYGGRGIKVCPEWGEFLPFFEWATKAGWRDGLFLDRQDNDGNYEPGNCRFVTVLVSNRNRSNVTINAAMAKTIHQVLEAKTSREIAESLCVPILTVRNIRRKVCWKESEL